MSIPVRSARIFLCGDVMLGRGIDQIMAYPSDPILYEASMTSAIDYVRLAELKNGHITRRASASYVWGAALDELARATPDVRIINLETTITRSVDYVPKGINYRMSPENADCLTAARIDCCVLANNHILDWGLEGLVDTLDRLKQLGIKTAGAGRNWHEAIKPAIFALGDECRLLVFSLASVTSGVPRSWAARSDRAGVNLLPDLGKEGAQHAAEHILSIKRQHDIVVVSVHWGDNWGYRIPNEQREFAHLLIETAGASVIYGHSAHHAKGIEVYRDRLVLYGCGDFINDYEGIEGKERFRDDLAIMYFLDIDLANGDLRALAMTPLQIRRFRLEPASPADVVWLEQLIDRESSHFGTKVCAREDGRFGLSW